MFKFIKSFLHKKSKNNFSLDSLPLPFCFELNEIKNWGYELSKSTLPATNQLHDLILRHQSIPFLLLLLIQRKEYEKARKLGQEILSSEHILTEEIKSTLYWLSELNYFIHLEEGKLLDHENTLRWIYALCFLSPDRGGFLEIDSPFYTEFESVSELAQEGLLFKDTLIENILSLWGEYEGVFKKEFSLILKRIFYRNNKIYQDRATWLIFWNREKEHFNKDYLFLVEGNLCFSRKEFREALYFYDKSLAENPNLKTAQINKLFTFAALKDKNQHLEWVNFLVSDKKTAPHIYSAVSNSFLLLSDRKQSDFYFEKLQKESHQEKNTYFHRSQFCYEHGLFRLALDFGYAALEGNRHNSSLLYHLALCYSALGNKEKALELIAQLTQRPHWIEYFKFTLERDIGAHSEAAQTLLNLPLEYFENEEEWEHAHDFAKRSRDFILLRHLRSR